MYIASLYLFCFPIGPVCILTNTYSCKATRYKEFKKKVQTLEHTLQNVGAEYVLKLDFHLCIQQQVRGELIPSQQKQQRGEE